MLAAFGAAVLCSYFGANGPSVYNGQNGLDENYASHVDQAGLGALRVNFRIDGKTQWDASLFAQYDAYMAIAKEHGDDVLGIVLYESLPGTQVDWNSGYDSTGYSAYVQSFVDTAKLLMSRYGDQVKNWEIWNEPNAWTNPNYANDPTNAGGTYVVPLVYAKMLAETFVQANSIIVAKGLHLISGGLFAHDIGGSFSPATDYAKQVLSVGPWDWMQQTYGRRYPWDGFGYHIYIDQGGATSSAHLGQYLDAIQTTKSAYSDGSPLWMTEFGWQTTVVSEATQASNLDIALQTFESRSDVARTFMFKVDDYDGWGLFRSDWSAKPSVATYQTHDQNCERTPPAPDAGSDASLDAAPPDAPTADAPSPPGDEETVATSSGCSCDVPDSPSSTSGWLLLGAAAASIVSRRRRPAVTSAAAPPEAPRELGRPEDRGPSRRSSSARSRARIRTRDRRCAR